MIVTAIGGKNMTKFVLFFTIIAVTIIVKN